MSNMSNRWRDCGRSFLALPRRVQWWVAAVLIPVNTAPFLLLGSDTGKIGALSSLLIVATNVPIMLHQRGMSRLMSVPHLFIWIPLCLWLWNHLQAPLPPTGLEWWLAVALLVANGISLPFDVVDSLRWLRGERAVPTSPCS